MLISVLFSLLASLAANASPYRVSGQIIPLVENGNATHAVFSIDVTEDTREPPVTCIGLPHGWVVRRATWSGTPNARKQRSGECTRDAAEQDARLVADPELDWTCLATPRTRYKAGARLKIGLRIYVPRSAPEHADVRWVTPEGTTTTRSLDIRRGLGPNGSGLPIPPAYEIDPEALARIVTAVNTTSQLQDAVENLDPSSDVVAEVQKMLDALSSARGTFDATTAGIPMELGFYTEVSEFRLRETENALNDFTKTHIHARLDQIDAALASNDPSLHRVASIHASEVESLTLLDGVPPVSPDRVLATTIRTAETLGDADALITRTTRCFQSCSDQATLGLAYSARARHDVWDGDGEAARAWCRTGAKRLDGSASQPVLIGACDALFEGSDWQ